MRRNRLIITILLTTVFIIGGGSTPVQAHPPIPVSLVTDIRHNVAVAFASDFNINYLKMIDEMNGWAITTENHVLLTMDGGTNWSDISPNTTDISSYDCFFLDTQNAWLALTSGKILRTSDGGKTWKTFEQPSQTGGRFSYHFTTPSDGWAINSGGAAGSTYIQIYETHDGGASFTPANLIDAGQLPNTLRLSNVCGDAYSFDLGKVVIVRGTVACGDGGTPQVEISHDGGQTLNKIQLSSPEAFPAARSDPQSPIFITDMDGFLPVEFFSDNSFSNKSLKIYATHNGGETWNLTAGQAEQTSFLQFVSLNDGFVLCQSNLCATHDGSQSWQIVQSDFDFTITDTRYVVNLQFINSMAGWLILKENDIYTLYKTTDGGVHWTTPTTVPPKIVGEFEGQIAYVGVDGNIYLIRGNTGETLQITTDATAQERYFDPAFSPDGKNLAFVRLDAQKSYDDNGPLFVFDTNLVSIQKITDQAKRGFQWLSGDSQIGYIQDNTLFKIAIATSNQTKVMDDVTDFLWSPDLSKIVFAKASENGMCGPSTYYVLNFSSNSITKVDGANSIDSWSSNSNWIQVTYACIEYGGTFPINSETGKPYALKGELQAIYQKMSFSPDGTKFVGIQPATSGRDENMPTSINIQDLANEATLDSIQLSDTWKPLWSPMGDFIAASDDIFGNTPIYLINSNTYSVEKLVDKGFCVKAWSPTGNQLLVFGCPNETSSGEMRIYDLSQRRFITNGLIKSIHDYGDKDIAWGKLPQANTQYTLSGNVDLSDNSPLPSTTILLDGAQATTTDQNGNFRIEGVSIGQHSVEPRLDGYTFNPPLEQRDVQGDIGDLKFFGEKIPPKTGYIIAGHVTDSNNHSLPGVNIILDGKPITTTDKEGQYRIENLASGKYSFGASLDGYYFRLDTLEFNLDSDKLHFDFIGHELKPLAMQLVGLEVTQGLQDLDNNISLIAGKPTIVRAYVTANKPLKDFSAKLIGRKPNGQELPNSPLYPENKIDVKVNPNMDSLRNDLKKTLNFEIPSEWEIGDVEFELKPFPESLDCEIPKGCRVKVTFQFVPNIDIKLFRTYRNDKNGSVAPSIQDVWDSMAVATEYLPVASLNPHIQDDTYSVTPDFLFDELRASNSTLGTKKFMDGCTLTLINNCQTIYFGLLVNSVEKSGTLGFTVMYTNTASAYWLGEQIPGALQNAPVAHELGHTLGRWHTPTTKALNGTSCLVPPWPDWFSPPYKGLSKETTGRNAVYGLSLRKMTIFEPTTPDLMAYCNLEWTSEWTYEELLKTIKERFGNSTSNHFININYLKQADSEQPTFVVSGIINTGSNTAKIESIYSVNLGKIPTDIGEGEYSLREEDQGGNILAETKFIPSPSTDNQSLSIFNVHLVSNPDAHRIQLLHNDQVIAENLASLTPPSVQVLVPNQGENWAGTTAHIEWQASDADNDSLQYAIQLSFDNGQTWRTEAVNLTDTKLDLPLEFIPGTKQALVRVLASDGFYTAQDASDAPFAISGHNPNANISSPSSGREYDTNHLIILYGNAYDAENGQLTNFALEWRSDKNGVLGTGQALTVRADTLQPGTHTITLTATDKDGNTAQSSIQVIVKAADGTTSAEPSQNIPSLALYGGIAFVGILLVGLFGLVIVVVARKRMISPKSLPIVRRSASVAYDNSPTQKAVELTRAGKYQESFAILRQVVQNEPQNARAWLFLGYDLGNIGDLKSAERCFLRAKQLGHLKADDALAWLSKKGA